LTNYSTEPALPPASHAEHIDAVMAELERARSHSDSGIRSIGLLAGSAILFIALGAWFWSIEVVLYLVPILLFHELGHYVAMRYFDYRNVKMFFLPLLGAAVSGQHFNIPSWKKVIVSLAGPIPGILLAIPMAVVAIQTESELWRHATLMIVLINVFNLLPLLPLDGGWTAHALYFCRQPWLDVLFRLTAAIAMISIGVTWQMYFFVAFGALMLLAVPTAIRNLNISKKLKSEGVEAASDDTTEIPRSFVESIVEYLPETGPGSLPKPQAQQARQIFDAIHSRPPGVAATVGLTLVYLAGWGISFGVLAVLFLWPQWQRDWSEAPVVGVSNVSEILVQRADEQPVDDHVNRYFVLGVCDRAADVKECAEQLQGHPECRFSFAIAGNALLVSLDIDQAESVAGKSMIRTLKSNVRKSYWFETFDDFHIQVDCVANDAIQAVTLADRANEMLMFGNDLGLVEPWSVDHQISKDQFHRRETRRILDAPFDAANDPALIELSEQLDRLSLASNVETTPEADDEANDEAARDRVHQQLDRYDLLYEQQYEAAVEEMNADDSGKYNREVLKHWSRRPGRFHDEDLNTLANTMEETSWRSKLADLLGRIPGTDPVGINVDKVPRPGKGTAEPFKYSMTAGIVSADDRRIQFRFSHFRNPITGFPAVMQWLQANGCKDLTFQILKNVDFESVSGM